MKKNVVGHRDSHTRVDELYCRAKEHYRLSRIRSRKDNSMIKILKRI